MAWRKIKSSEHTHLVPGHRINLASKNVTETAIYTVKSFYHSPLENIYDSSVSWSDELTVFEKSKSVEFYILYIIDYLYEVTF